MPHQPGTIRRNGAPCCGRSGWAIHAVHEQHVVTQCVGQRQAAPVVLLDSPLESVVSSGESHVDGAVPDACLTQQRRQRGACPLGRADGLVEPRLADWARGEPGSAVACALECDAPGDRWTRLHRGEVERQRMLQVSVDLQPPGPRVEVGDVVVGQQVVQANRCDLVPERLQRHAVVASRQAQLVQ